MMRIGCCVSWKIFLVGFVISLILVQNALCDGAEDTAAKTKKKVVIKLVKKSDNNVVGKTSDKPVIVMAEKVVSPQNWNSWTPISENSTKWMPTAQPTPLSSEEKKRREKIQEIQKERIENFEKTKKKQQVKANPTTNPITSFNVNPSSVPNVPNPVKHKKAKPTMEILKKQVMHYGRMLFNTISSNSGYTGQMARLAASAASLLASGSGEGRHSDNVASGSEHVEESFFETEGRGALDWLSRLIGVQGKTLGDFLREYQVHVLYDLVFIFFKWIFFVYAGLLIP